MLSRTVLVCCLAALAMIVAPALGLVPGTDAVGAATQAVQPAADAIAASDATAGPADAGPASHPLQLLAYSIFLLFVLGMLALDLGVFHRNPHNVTFKEAAVWSAVWITLAMLFNVGVYFLYEHHVFDLGLDVPVLGEPGVTKTVAGGEAAGLFFTAYVLEKSLSMDNVFVISLIFAGLGIPNMYQHRVLFWGIIGALVMRGLMIALGAKLVAEFAWISYVFGGILILTAIKMALLKESHNDPKNSPIVKLFRRVLPITDEIDGQRFLVRKAPSPGAAARLMATPLLVALVLVEFTDLLFAVDSIPAVFAVTSDPFLVFATNIMAILGLRSLYFCLASMIQTFRFLKPGLIIVLGFVGVKMCLVHTPLKIDTWVSMGVVGGVLGAGVLASILKPGQPSASAGHGAAPSPPHDPAQPASASPSASPGRTPGHPPVQL